MRTVATGESHSGRCKPNDLESITDPRKAIEYIAPFLRYLYLFIASTFLTVSCLTTMAPIPLPASINGTEKVKAKAPRTPSIENDASIASRYSILLQSLIHFSQVIKHRSRCSAFCLNPCVMKKTVEPVTAPKASIGLT